MTSLLRRLFTTPYAPDLGHRSFLERSECQESPLARVCVAVLDTAESSLRFGVSLAAHGVQPVHLRVENRATVPLRLHAVSLDPSYFTAGEAAALCQFSFLRRASAFGLLGWLFLPFLLLAPLKLLSAVRANRRMERCFRAAAFRLRPVPPGESAEGFVFTTADYGTKELCVRLLGSGGVLHEREGDRSSEVPLIPTDVEFVFSIPVGGISADHLHRDLVLPRGMPEQPVELTELLAALRAMPATTTSRNGAGSGDPVNLVLIGEHARLLSGFAGRWDETETITLTTCWKTLRAFLLGSQYRYSPVSALYLFGRSQDIALQRIRESIHERLHLRLWLTPLRFHTHPVWVGQVSRDIGVRFTPRTWNLTTHRIDADVDESRDYVVEDLLQAGRIEAAGYVEGVGATERADPRRNLTGDPWFTDGRRAVILLAARRTEPRFVQWE